MMPALRRLASAMALAASAAAPLHTAAAADAYGFPDRREERAGAFVGAYARLPLGEGPGRAAPEAGLTLAMTRSQGMMDGTPRLDRRRADAFALSLAGGRPPELRLAGMRLSLAPSAGGTPGSLHADGTGGEDDGFPWLYAGGAVLAVAAVGAGIFFYRVAEGNRNSD